MLADASSADCPCRTPSRNIMPLNFFTTSSMTQALFYPNISLAHSPRRMPSSSDKSTSCHRIPSHHPRSYRLNYARRRFITGQSMQATILQMPSFEFFTASFIIPPLPPQTVPNISSTHNPRISIHQYKNVIASRPLPLPPLHPLRLSHHLSETPESKPPHLQLPTHTHFLVRIMFNKSFLGY